METDGRYGNYRLTFVPKFSDKVVKHFAKTSGERIVAVGAMDGTKEIWIGKAFFPLSPRFQEDTLIHELSHQAANTEDHAYLRENIYLMGAASVKLTLDELLSNADSIAKFVSCYR